MRNTGVKAHPAQLADTARGLEPKRAAARKHDRVDIRRHRARVQCIELSGTRSRAPDIHATDSIGPAENRRASGARDGVRRRSRQNAGNAGQPLHIALVSNPLYASIDFVDVRVLKRVQTTQCLKI